MVRLLPLFPLPAVLFPGTPMPLHIFEPRYRRMLVDVLAADGRFGLVHVEAGADEQALPRGAVGCIARVLESEALPDGRSNIVVEGEARFALQRLVPAGTPYLVGEIASWDDDPALGEPGAAETESLDAEVRELFGRVAVAARRLEGKPGDPPVLPDAPELTAFAIAAMIDLDDAGRQRLLESRSPLDRLRTVHALLRRAVAPLEARAAVRVRAKSNGRGPRAPGA